MSRTDALAFLSRLESDAALRQAAAKATAGHFAENLIALGAKQGLSFSENDLLGALASKQPPTGSAQLSDEDLENAAGGSPKQQKTAQMFEILRSIIEKYDASAKSVIQNIGR
jgi:predicted ribosomally synthesized peptide with nif11-like leader